MGFRVIGTEIEAALANRRGRLWLVNTAVAGAMAIVLAAWAPRAAADVPPSSPDDALILQAREAYRTGDARRLASLSDEVRQRQHPLASWVDYWALGARLKEARQDELEAFYQRWPSTYVEDRLRNDWLLVLGERRDWTNFRRDHPRFQMADDREVDCYALLIRHLEGDDVRVPAQAAWMAQRRDDDGCDLMASTLVQAGQFGPAEVWPALRLAAETNRPRAAKADAAMLSPADRAVALDALDNPARWLARHNRSSARGAQGEAAVVALLRVAVNDPDVAATQAADWDQRLSAAQAGYVWAGIGRRAAMRLLPTAAGYYARAFRQLPVGQAADWPVETLEWAVRAALRADEPTRWPLILRAVDAMAPGDQIDHAWVYWKARALQATAQQGEAGAAQRQQSQLMLQALAGPQSFYALLALEDTGGRFVPPTAPAALTASEQAAVRAVPGLQRALQLLSLGLRSEGVREWNFTLRELKEDDRALLAAAQWACDREVWDRCINTSDRTRGEVSLAQRYPTPFSEQVLAKAKDAGLDPAYVYGLIRQESRFILDARSGVGASGLMQLMPATARWTARKIGLPYNKSMITDRDVNLRLGMAYLKLLLDDFEGAQPLAIAGYNAGPNRPRRWREGPVLETAAWVENIPFDETRDYVKKVLANSVHYAAVLGQPPMSLKAHLGTTIGPRPQDADKPDEDLP
jgi:soluble lytic murein transglycosylase